MSFQLRPKQLEVYDCISSGKNVFLTGSAGVGKTEIIKKFFKEKCDSKKIAMTSTTGTSALLFGGVTLHSYTGIGLGKDSVEHICTSIFQKSMYRTRWTTLDILIIDEISMLSPELFDKLEEIARVVRRSVRPFGGLQLILSGDFCQLPCVDSEKFCFQANSWDKCIHKTFYLTEIIRQSDTFFQECLNNIRIGNICEKVTGFLQGCVGKKLTNEYGIEPTLLYSHNKDVNLINSKKMENICKDGRQTYEYEMEIEVRNTKYKETIMEKFKKNSVVPHLLTLCIGAQVMLVYNMDLQSGLANGSRGIVSDFTQDSLPIVTFLNGVQRVIDYHTWEITENEEKILIAVQIPLKLAFALSIHKSQGCSLDYVKIDISKVFEYGQAYVALSRAKKLEGLSIIAFDLESIQAHPLAIDFYKKL